MMLLDNSYMTGQTVAMSGGMAFNWRECRRLSYHTHHCAVSLASNPNAIFPAFRHQDQFAGRTLWNIGEIFLRSTISALAKAKVSERREKPSPPSTGPQAGFDIDQWRRYRVRRNLLHDNFYGCPKSGRAFLCRQPADSRAGT
jgi:hypothetical protein